MVYAIVKAGGRQERVSVGDVVVMDRVVADTGSKIELTPVLLVDGDKVTTEAKALAKVKVTAEVIRDERGPKVTIGKFKNKTGYRRRQGHRQELTRIKITGIK
ncbi:MAG: 50S ribosomal protein L21 [Beutenbergiaceae bacterium]